MMKEAGSNLLALDPQEEGWHGQSRGNLSLGVSGDLWPRPSTGGPPGFERGDKRKFPETFIELFSEDDIRRRRGAVRAFALDKIPFASRFREFVQNTFVKVTASSKRSKARTLSWLQEVESCTNVAALEIPSRRWDELDTALAEAVVASAKGPLKR